MDEGRIVEAAEAVKVRKSLAAVSLAALSKLTTELSNARIVTEDWSKKFKIVADQIRRDYHVPKEAAPAAEGACEPVVEEENPADPLSGLRLISEENEVA